MTKKRQKQIELVLAKKGLISTPMKMANILTILNGGKVKVSVGQMREGVKLILDLIEYEEEGFGQVFESSFAFSRKNKKKK